MIQESRQTAQSEREHARRQRVEELFEAAATHAGAERSAFLDRECASDIDLRREVEQLLRYDESDHAFIDAAPVAQLSEALRVGNGAPPIGAKLGAYVLLEVIGEGGMGVVYLAEQENPRRTVALKVLRPGLLARSALRRFDHEAQVLGVLDHAAIAKIIEAGTTEIDGQPTPYFAMEYVKGVSLRAYVREHALATEQILRLFLQICDGVQHAHQKGVIHRDLKPGNVLVTADGQVKILDFGVARVTAPDLELTSHQTMVGQLIGTLPYMSPEQAGGDPAQLDTRSDIYSLGVVLYQLLAGVLPYDVEAKSLTEAISIVREHEPRSLGALRREFRGDLATIVAKTLAKDKERRYQTIGELGADVRRYLQHEPIAARPPSAVYLLRKYTRRHKTVIAGLAIGVVALFVGSGLAIWQAVRAREESRHAKRESDKFAAMNRFLIDMLQAPSPDRVGPEVRVVDILDAAAVRLRADYRDQLELRLPLEHAIASSYNTLGQPAKARAIIEDSLPDVERIYGPEHLHTIQVLNALSDMLGNEHNFKRAREVAEQALALGRKALGPLHPDLLAAKLQVGKLLVFNKARRREGVEMLREAVDGLRSTSERHDRRLIVALLDLAPQLESFAEQEALYQDAIARLSESRAEDNPLLLRAQGSYALTLHGLHRIDEAERLLKHVIEVFGRKPDAPNHDLIAATQFLTQVLSQQGRHEESAEAALANLRAITRNYGDDSVMAAEGYALHGAALTMVAKFAEAEAALLRALAIQARDLAPDHQRTKHTLHRLIKLYEDWQRPDEAEKYRQRLAAPPAE
ncbi:MAG: protein kinase domain-containing protein [Planctomycetota bacterium]